VPGGQAVAGQISRRNSVAVGGDGSGLGCLVFGED